MSIFRGIETMICKLGIVREYEVLFICPLLVGAVSALEISRGRRRS
jgi:hypothetical protein